MDDDGAALHEGSERGGRRDSAVAVAASDTSGQRGDVSELGTSDIASPVSAWSPQRGVSSLMHTVHCCVVVV
jgi:hypothetical protein